MKKQKTHQAQVSQQSDKIINDSLQQDTANVIKIILLGAVFIILIGIIKIAILMYLKRLKNKQQK